MPKKTLTEEKQHEEVRLGDEAERDKDLSLLKWGEKYLPEHFARPPSAMHVWLSEQLGAMGEERGSKINLIGPRGSAKSTLVTLAYVLRAAVEGRERYIWIITDSADQVRIHLDNLRLELVENDKLRWVYVETTGRGKHWRRDALQLRNQVIIESYGSGQGLRGRRRRALRPTLIVCDDLQNDSHIISARERERSRRWFHGTLLNAGTPDTNVVHLATALHHDALALELARAPGWTSRTFPAIEAWPTNMKLWKEWEEIFCKVDNPNARHEAREFYKQRKAEMDAGAEVLWPALENLYTLMKMRVEIGSTAFEREKQGQPLNPESCEWPEDYFADHIWFDTWPSELVVRAIALDPSMGRRDTRRREYSAFVLLGIDAAGVIYVEADLARRPTPRMVTDGAALCRRFQPTVFGVEANQYQELLCGELEREFARQGLQHVVPAAIHNLIPKQMRIRKLGPYLSQRRLRFLAGSASTKLLVSQLRDFPTGAQDDGPDALEMALRLAEEVLHGRNLDDGLGDRLVRG